MESSEADARHRLPEHAPSVIHAASEDENRKNIEVSEDSLDIDLCAILVILNGEVCSSFFHFRTIR